VLTGASSVKVTRYRYRGSNIATPGPEPGIRRQRRMTSGKDTRWRPVH
jgi:hypothetical protein